MPAGGGPYLDQRIEFQRDAAQVKYDPAAQEAAAEQRRQAVRDAMARPPVDAPNYRRAMQEKRGILTAAMAPGGGAAGAPVVISLGESKIQLLPPGVLRGWRTVFDVLVLGALAVAAGVLHRQLRRSQ